MTLRLGRWLVGGEWRAHPLRAAVAAGAIALGVALGYAIQLINAAAFNEFSAAVHSVSGQADLQVRGALATLDEDAYPRIAMTDGVALASPVLEIDLPGGSDRGPLKILGIDALRAAHVAPDLLGVPASSEPASPYTGFDDDAVFLSPAAQQTFDVRPGDVLALRAGTRALSLRVAGGIAQPRAGQRIAVMDIAAAQLQFGLLGKLSRIDVRLAPGVPRAAMRARLAALLGPGFVVSEPAEQEERTADMSRAYRVNLNVLALVALFTGAFLVFANQALSVLRRRSQFALLRVTGMTRRALLAMVLAESALIGSVGALLGLAGGWGVAAAALHFFGSDLGGGYFPGVQPSLQFSPWSALAYFGLGLAIALLGGLAPAREAARARPAAALKAGSEDRSMARLAAPWPGLFLLALAGLLVLLPPVAGLPLFGYAAVACLLVGGIQLMPRLASLLARLLAACLPARHVLGALATARLRQAPNQAAIALGGVLASFSLMVAMAIMVASFRASVDDWLAHLLPADLYLRSAAGGASAGLDAQQQAAIAALPGVARAEFLRALPLTLDARRPNLTLLARPVERQDPGRTLPLVGEALPVPDGLVPVYVSEAVVDLYGWRPGMRVRLPFTRDEVFVAATWRDYARQSGAVLMPLADYRRLTGDLLASDASLWLAPGHSVAQLQERLRALPFGAALELAQPMQIRALSLQIFDRSFAITYLLEAIAVALGMFGVATTFSAQVLARAREFGMLRHIGLTRGQVMRLLAAEGALLGATGIGAGFLLGWAISLVLVHVVNPQSFHWTMQMHMPWALLGQVAALLFGAATLAAFLAGRHAVRQSALRAVREDW